MAIDITFSGPAQVDVDIAAQDDLEIDLLPEHRLGQHVDFDDADTTAGHVVTRKSDGQFDMQAPAGGSAPVDSVFSRTGVVVAAASDYDASLVDNDSGVAGAFVDDALDTLKAADATHAALGSLHISIGTTPPGSPSDGWVFIDTDGAVLYIYESTRGHWLGMPEKYTFGGRGSYSSGQILRTAGNVSPQGANDEGHMIPFEAILVAYSENSDSHPATAGADLQIRRDNSVIYSVDMNSATFATQSKDDTLDVDFGVDGTLTVISADFVSNNAVDTVLDLWFRRKWV